MYDVQGKHNIKKMKNVSRFWAKNREDLNRLNCEV